jgi:hypothetical protein
LDSGADETRIEIARLARQKDARIVPNSTEMPCNWYPTTVTSSAGLPFTPSGAWHFIADLAESGHAIEKILMEKPQGEIGYVMVKKSDDGSSDIYVKVQLKRGRIWGRSFHYSTKPIESVEKGKKHEQSR